ncbi:Ig-like domain repeat protein [Variovorax atrisoli]|uniref:Ig-like domain repeat protein n=1 Tax=Variovorax atrisoli TaxID=3394203 RepID=UPI00403FF26C
MVAIVSGNSLGLSLSSLAVLGQRGQLGTAGQGRSGEQSFVNVASGNLVLQDRDDILMGRGLDVQAVRTYNSQGLLNDDNGDNWSVGAFGQKAVLTSGAVGAAGSTVTRTDRDGAQATYTWDVARNRYISSAGSGAFDTIAYDSGASEFVWTDGDTGCLERYLSTGDGRLLFATDTDGNTVSYAYNANGTVRSVTDANGDVSYYDYSGTNLTQIRTVTGGVTTTTVRYEYDASDRLTKVIVDLSPGDNTVSDSNVYVTTYTYDGASKRVASVTQSDGTKLSFTYVQVGGSFKVETVTDALGAVTRFSYDTAQNTTTVTDALGAKSIYLYDAQGQLTQVRNGVTATNANGLSQISYAYDAEGNVTLVTDGEGNKVTLQYDDQGNLTREVDSAGDTRVRTYNSANQLLTDTIYADAAVTDRGAFNKDAALPETTRYVYAAGNANQLRFAITAQGNVTEYRYDAYGQRTSAIRYAGAAYDTSALALAEVPTEAQLSNWAAAQDLTRTELTEMAYDARGQLSSSTTYAATAANGSGAAGTGATTQYIYDPRGLLLQKIEPATTAGGSAAITTYTYDGLGRVLSVSAPSLDGGTTPNTTITSYDDANGKTSVTIASGLVTVSAYDKAGRLVSVTQQSAGTGVLGTTRYVYDKDGNLLMTQDPTGVRKWMLYDEADRKIAEIDATGAVIEYVYNANGQLRETIAYATKLSAAQLAQLVDGTGQPTTAWSATNTVTSLAALRPVGVAQDQKVWRFYDTANRLAWQVDALGYVTHTTYDGASRILSVTQLANPIDVSRLGNGANVELLVDPATVGGVALSIDPAPVRAGTSVTLTANIEGANPGGMVTFFNGEAIIGSAPVVNGVATLATTELPVGINNIRAAYSGDQLRPSSVSGVVQKNVGKVSTSAVLKFNPLSPSFGSLVSISLEVKTLSPAALDAATGMVSFYWEGALLGTANVVNGLATFTTANLPVGMQLIHAEYSGDATHEPVVGNVVLTVEQAKTKTSVSIAKSGGVTLLTATVSTKFGATTSPGGTVTFYSGSTVIGSAQLYYGYATLGFFAIPAGEIYAVYQGDGNNASSTSSNLSLSRSKTATTVSFSPPTGTSDTTFELTADIAGASPSGIVTFVAGSSILGTAEVVNGRATLKINNLAEGVKFIQATYSGDSANLTSVSPRGTTIQIIAGGTGTAPPLNQVGESNPYLSPQTQASGVTGGPALLYMDDWSNVFQPLSGTWLFFYQDTLLGSQTAYADGFAAWDLPVGDSLVTVKYSGDPYHSRTVDGVSEISVHVSRVAPYLTASSPTEAVVGSPVTVSLTLDTTGGLTSGPPPTGKVTFYRGSSALGTATVINGVATFTLNGLSVGRNEITATFAGNALVQSSSLSWNIDVKASAQAQSTALDVTSSPPLPQAGSPTVITAAVRPIGEQTAFVDGIVDFYLDGVLLGSAELQEGRASLTSTSLPVGASGVSAVYRGNNAYAISSNRQSVNVYKSTTSTTVTASGISGVQGETLTLTAQVQGANANGVVTFFSGKRALGVATVINGYATLAVNDLPPGLSLINASYSGDARNVTSASLNALAINIAEGSPPVSPLNPIGTAPSTVSVWVNDGMLGLPVSIGAVGSSTSGHPLSGTFSYFSGDTLIGSQVVGTSFSSPNLPVGAQGITVVYSGDAYNAAAVSTTKTLTIRPATTTTQVKSSASYSLAGEPLTLTATVSHWPDSVTWGLSGNEWTQSTAPVPSGTVTFYQDGVSIGAAPLVNGVATLAGLIPAGSGYITAVYSGDESNAGNTSASIRQTIVGEGRITYTRLRSVPTMPVVGSTITLSADISGSWYVANGTVSFYDGTTLLGTVLVNGPTAALRISGLTVGTHEIRAVYSGDTANLSSTTTAIVSVVRAPIALNNMTASTIGRDGPLSIQAEGALDGSLVNFYSGTRLLGTARVFDGIATLTGVNLPPGTHVFTAAFSGDVIHADGELSFSQIVEGAPVTTVYANLDLQQDRTVTELYNRDGRLQGTLDAEGYLTEYKYDAAGELAQTIRYAERAADFNSVYARIAAIAVARASYNLSGLRPDANSSADLNAYNFYDAQGRLVGQVDGEGYLTETIYDPRGNVTQIKRYASRAGVVSAASTVDSIRPAADAARDQVTVQTWSDANQLVSRTNAEGTVTQFVYDSLGQLVETTTAAGTVDARTSRLRYDIQGRLIGELDGRGSDAVALSDPLALWAANGLTHTYDAAGRRTSTTDANGHRTLFFYDPIGRLRYTVNALGEVTESKYNALGLMDEQVVYGTRVDVATLGAATPGGLNTATLSAQLAAVADATKDAHVLSTFNATGTRASTTDALGHVTSYSYNAFREAIASAYTLVSGQVVTDTATFDRRGLQKSNTQDSTGVALTRRTVYDAFGRVTDRYDGNNNRTQIAYDRLGRIVKTTDALSGQHVTTYDAFDRVLTQRDALNNTTNYSYSIANRSVTVTTPEGVVVTTVRTRNGQTQSVTDGRGNVTTYGYDKSGNLLQASATLDANTTVTTGATYDKTGLKLTSTDANGVVTSYTYDAANRLLTRTLDPTGLNLTTTYAYDAKGQAVNVTDPRGTVTTTEFDLAGQTVRQVVDPTGLHLTTSYTHDTTGKVLTVTDPNGNVTQYTYDGAGRRIKEQIDPLGLNLTRSYEYDAANNVTRAIDANGNATRYAYDANNRLVFTLDALGNLSKQEYDAEGRVTRRTSYAMPIDTTGLGSAPTVAQIQAKVVVSTGSDVVESRRYDRDGRLSFSVDGTGAVVQYIYDKANNVIETRAYANRINLAGWNIAVDPPVAADAARDERVRTVYDALNRAIWKVDGAGGVVQNFYDANGNVTESVAYANPLTGAAFNSWNGTSAPSVVADATRDQRIRTVYDTANRGTWSVDALGNVTQRTYDAAGNVLTRQSYATPLTVAALSAWGGHTAPAPVADPAHDQRVRNVYDAAGRLTWSVDGVGAVTKTEYDANGNVTRRIQYASPVAEGSDPAGVASSPSDRITISLYDASNRQTWRVDALGAVTRLQYDGNGQVVDQRSYANTVNPGDAASAASLASALAGKADDAHDVRIRNVYDAAGRLTWQADGTGAVTGSTYDGTGRLVRQVQYATPVVASALPSSAVASGTDRITVFAHDGAGRRTFTVDTLGGVTRTVYDAFGNVTQQVGYANPVAAPGVATAYTEAALQVAVSANAGADRIQRFAYDQANRQVFSVDALGGTTESTYDGLGQMVQSRRYAKAIDTSGLSPVASAGDIRARTAADATNDRISRQVFDAAGRAVYGLDAMGFVTRTDYDGLAQVRQTVQYALSIPLATANTAAAIADAVVEAPGDRGKTFQYDAAGRVVSSVDAMGFTESWGFDVLGNKTSYTNAKGAVWTYAYDQRGRMVREVSPQVALTAVVPGADGRLQVDAGSSGVGNVVTELSYDSFGNLRSRTEGVGRPEQRTTVYGYDQVGRQVKVTYPPVGVYNPAGDGLSVEGLDGRHDTVQTLYTETTYDALGNAVANRDIGGNYSYKTYDLVGRVAYDVDALGFATGYQRNAFGDAVALTRYNASTGLAAAHPASLSTAQVRGSLNTQDAGNRTILTDYDRLGRAIQVTEPQSFVYDSSATSAAGSQYLLASKTTRNTYNTFGELTQVALRKNATDWTLTTNFYNQKGQQVATVDAMGYVTIQAFDAAGNTTVRVEYAQAAKNPDGSAWAGTSSLAGWTGLTNAGGTPPTSPPDAANDRRVDIFYDRNNRKTSEIRRNVEYSTASNGTNTRGDLTTSYGYDAVGNLTSTTDAKGATTYSYYDALGRVTAVAEPTRAGSDGATPVTPLTVFRRDAYGNVVLKTEYLNGADANGNPLSPSTLGLVQVPNPQVAQLAANGWTNVGPVGYFSPVPFAGGVPIYQIHATLFPNLYKYVTQAELAAQLAPVNGIAVWGEPTVIGYVAQTQTPDTRPLYRMRQKSDLEFTQLVADPNEITRLQGLGWSLDLDGSGNPLVLGYLGASGAGAMDTPLQMVMQLLPFVDPNDLTPILGEEHRYLPGTVKVDPMSDPSAFADAIANSDRTTFSQYDALGHKVQSTDAMGVNHYSSYNAQGLIAKEWQGVTDNAGTTRTLFRAYQYDALGRQTHVLDPGTPSDNAVYTEGAASQGNGYVNNPKATVVPGGYGPNYGQVIYGNDNSSDGTHGDVPIGVDTTVEMGKFTLELAQLANLLDLKTAAGFRVEFDYVTPERPPKMLPGTTVPSEPAVPAHTVTYGQDFTDMSLLDTATSVDLVPGDSYGPIGPNGSVLQIRIYQLGIVFPFPTPIKEPTPRWQGTQAQADGQNALTSGPGASGTVVDTTLNYNAFGELVSKGVVGQAGGEYFDYDNAGRLWRTNAGDGVDKVALYDLQGHQTADIRSTGQGRADLNLRNFGSAQEVAGLADVRRTNTTYDLLGRVVSTALPERLESQGGVSVHTGVLSTAVSTSNGADGKNVNAVILNWPGYLGGLGSGDVQVIIHYIAKDANGNDVAASRPAQIFRSAQSADGVQFSWSEDNRIQRVTHVTVDKEDLFGHWTRVIDKEGTGYVGQSVDVAAPKDPGATVVVQVRVAGSSGDSGWTTVPTTRYGDSLRYDASGLGLGTYEYRVFTQVPGDPASLTTPTATGTLSITPHLLATISLNTSLGVAPETFAWQSPQAGDTQVIRLRVAGSQGPWTEQSIGQPQGGWSGISLAGLAGGTYEYELLWTHPGDAGPYAHATGQLNKVAAVPGTPEQVIAPVGLPHIDGVTVISPYPYEPNNGEGQPVYVPAMRLPVMLPYLSSLQIGVPGGILVPQNIVYPDGLYGYYIPSHSPSLSPGVYTYVYSYSIAPNVLIPTHHATGQLTVNGDGSISITDTTPAYQPGYTIPGTPGSPAQYGWAATASGPYAVSQDPMLGGPSLGIVAGINGSSGYQRPIVNQNVDRWGNVVSITDPRSTAWKTTYSYNANNQLIRQVQTDADGNLGVDANGNVNNANAPVTQIYYDAMGRQVAVRDANGNVNGQEWDAGGNLVRELHADDGVISHAYNAFGDKVRTIDAVNRTTTFLYDKLDRLVRTNRGSGGEAIAQWQSWDQAGRKLSQTNGAGDRIKYDYDLRGNLIRTTQPLGQTTLAAYDALNRKIIEMDANGAVAAWRYDYFGQLKGHTDIGGARYTYTYDNARQLVAQGSSGGPNGAQNRTYAYDAAGQQIRIEDLAIGQTTTYRYDLAGRRLRETTVQGGITYQDNSIAYDALGRIRWVADTRAYISIDYDKVGNRTHVGVHVNDPSSGVGGNDHYIDKYYAYDAMNRQTMVDAQRLANGTLVLGAEGHRLTYFKDGNRESDTHNSDQRVVQVNGQWTAVTGVTGETQEVYAYDTLGRLKTNTRDGVTIDTRVYDGADRVLMSGVVLGVGGVDFGYINAHNLLNGGPLPADLAGGPLRGDINTYDANGRLIAQVSNSVGVTPVHSETTYKYDAVGNMVLSESASLAAGSAVATHSAERTRFERAEGYQVKTRETGATGQLPGYLGYAYDANGHMVRTIDAHDNLLPQHRFVNDANGTVLYADYTSAADPNTAYNGQRQMVVNGEVLGRYGQTIDQRYPQGNPFIPGVDVIKPEVSFSFGYQPIDGNYPSGSPGVYAVQVNDTLQSIAKGAYGDGNLWYLIADANGLMSNADLRAGQVLTIPTRVTSANNVNTFKPYDPSKIANDTPTMLARPQDEKGCGGVGQVIVAVITAVVAIYTGGIAGAMLGSVVGQTAGVAMGVQDGISWKQVALAGVSAGVSAGLADVMPTPLGGVASDIPNVMVRAAVGNALTQGIGVATGLQNKFSWTGVIASAAGAGVGQAISTAIGGLAGSENYARFDEEGNLMPGASPNAGGRYFASEWANSVSPATARFVSGAVGGFAGGLTAAAMRGGKISVVQVAADAFGNALGESLAAANSSSGSTYVSQDEKLRDQFWEQSLGPVGSRGGYKTWPNSFDPSDPANGVADVYGRMVSMLDGPSGAVSRGWARPADMAFWDSENPSVNYQEAVLREQGFEDGGHLQQVRYLGKPEAAAILKNVSGYLNYNMSSPGLNPDGLPVSEIIRQNLALDGLGTSDQMVTGRALIVMSAAAQANVSKSYFDAISPSINFVNNYPFAQEYSLAKSFLIGLGNDLGTFQEGGRTYNYFGNREGDWANDNLLKDNLNSPAYRTFYDTYVNPPSSFGQSLKQNWPTLLGQAVTLALGARGMTTSPQQLSRAVASSRNLGTLADAMLAEANFTNLAVTRQAGWGRANYSGNPSEPGFVGPKVPEGWAPNFGNIDAAAVEGAAGPKAPTIFNNQILESGPRPFAPWRAGGPRSNDFLYVVEPDGNLVMSPIPKNGEYGHYDLTGGGNPVIAAGEGHTYGGKVKLDNVSGHYRPEGGSAQSAATAAFEKAGFTVTDYTEKVFDFKLGRWVKKQ